MRGATTRIGPRLLLAATPTPIPNITVKIGCANGVTTPGDEDPGQHLLPALDVGEAEVLDVLGEREAGRHDAGIDHPVGDAVELPPPQPPHQDDEQSLGGLLDEGAEKTAVASAACSGSVAVENTTWALVLSSPASRAAMSAPQRNAATRYFVGSAS